MIQILNLRRNSPTKPYDFIVDRRSPVGNPHLLVDEEDRDLVCDLYGDHFAKQDCAGNSKFAEYLRSMQQALEKYGKVRLFCWCPPKDVMPRQLRPG